MGFQKWSRFAVFVTALAILAGGLSVSPASAAKLGDIDVSGYVDLYTAWNLNKPAALVIPLHQFEVSDVSIGSLQRAEIVFDHSRFRLDLGYGPVDTLVTLGGTLPLAPSLQLQQAFIKWPLKWMDRTVAVDVGKFVTHMGFEVIESKDNWLYSRGLLFQFAIPYWHSGIRASVPINDNWWAMGALYNGWNNLVVVRRGLTYGLQVGGKFTPQLTTILNYITGEDAAAAAAPNAARAAFSAAGVGSSSASVFDLVAMYDVNEMLSLGLNFDSGSAAAPTLTTSTYTAWALYAKGNLATGTVIGRYENFTDNQSVFVGQGAGGTATTVSSLTIGYDVPLQKSTTGRVEYRLDSVSPGTPFLTSGAASASQSVITAGLVTQF